MAFDPWSYEKPIGEGMCTINALSYSAALADYEAGTITAEQVQQVADLFAKTRPCGGGVTPAGCAAPVVVALSVAAIVLAVLSISGA